MLREGEAWLGRGRDRASALHAAVHQACPSALARELLSSRVDHLSAEAAAAIVEHREKVFDAIASVAPETVDASPVLAPQLEAAQPIQRDAEVRPIRVAPDLS